MILYMLILVGIGIYKMRGVKNADDFMVAGRSLTVPVLVGTLVATWMGSGSLMGGAGLAFRKGLPALWFDVGVWIAAGAVLFFAARVRRFAQYTVPDILGERYNFAARILGSLVTIIAYTAIVSYQFKAGGIVLHYVTGLPPATGTLITAIFVIAFTAMAGLVSVAVIDVINGAVMGIGMLVVFPFLLMKAGGLAGMQATLPAEMFSVMGDMTFLKAASYSLPTMLLFLGEANMFQRFFSAKDEDTAKRAVSWWIVGTIIAQLLIVGLAIIGRALYPELLAADKSEMIIIHLARHALPTFAGCLLLAAGVSMIISTADSFLLTPVNNLVHDIYGKTFHGKATPTHLLWISRGVTVLLGIVAFAQLQFFRRVLDIAIYAYTMYGVGITPAVLAAFFWKRATTAGGVSSIAAGMIVTLIWEIFTPGTALAPMLGETLAPLVTETVYPALAASLICLFGVSLATAKPAAEQWQPFFAKAA
jgi:solute:Na+ symporter, SSS family